MNAIRKKIWQVLVFLQKKGADAFRGGWLYEEQKNPGRFLQRQEKCIVKPEDFVKIKGTIKNRGAEEFLTQRESNALDFPVSGALTRMEGAAMREIREIGTEWIEPYLDIYLNAYPAFKTLDEKCREEYREKTKRDMTMDQQVHFIGAFEDGVLAATMKVVELEMNIYGKMEKAAGLMSLAVHPLYKKRGIALDMVRAYEEIGRRAGALVAVLLPFNIRFYANMGYGLGGKMDEYHIPTSALPKCRAMSGLRLLTLADLPEIICCHSRYAEKTHGMMKKFEEEIRDMERDTVTRRVGVEEGGQLRGYAAYRFEEGHPENYTVNRIVVDELIYEDGEVLRSLLGYLRNQQDLAETVVIRSGEEDFYHLLENPQDMSGHYIPYGYLETNVSAVGNMYKVLDPERFVQEMDGRRFPSAECTARFIYEDALENKEKTLLIHFSSAGKVEVGKDGQESSPDVTISLGQGKLSSLLMNGCRLSSLIRLGGAQVNDPEQAARLDRIMYFPSKPYSNTDF